MIASSAKRAALGGLLTAVSLIFSYVESLIPVQLFIPVPGFKLGLANICVTLAFFYLGVLDAALISLAKVVLTSLLFGSSMSFLFSLAGAVFAFMFLLLTKYFIKDRIGFIGVSVSCAALHNAGQICAAAAIFKDFALFVFLEWLLPVSVATGIITGCLTIAVSKIAEKKL